MSGTALAKSIVQVERIAKLMFADRPTQAC